MGLHLYSSLHVYPKQEIEDSAAETNPGFVSSILRCLDVLGFASAFLPLQLLLVSD